MEANTASKPTVLSTGLKFGLILGIVSVLISMLQKMLGSDPLQDGWVRNLINLVITVTAIVFAHKSFKDKGDGYMSYGQGLMISLVTVMLSLILVGIYRYIYLTIINPAAFEEIWVKAAAEMEAQGQSDDAIEMALGLAKKFFWIAFLVGGLFWGCILGLIVSIFTQKKAPEQIF